MKIFTNTVSDTLWASLIKLMNIPELDSFRLVGGTSLSLLLGHRISLDIDMFTDVDYGSINFIELLKVLEKHFKYIDSTDWSNESIGNSCFIGDTPEDTIKLDLFYTDPFVYPVVKYQNIRLSRLEEICAMKLDVIGRGGRKKDFWDIHMLLDTFTIQEMIGFYLLKYPYGFSETELRAQLINFESAEDDFEPICLEGKYWELIKLDIEEALYSI